MDKKLVEKLKEKGLSEEEIKEILETIKKEELKEAEKPSEVEGKIIGEEKLETRVCPTGRGAIFRLKRAFYATISSEKADLEKSQEKWRTFASKIVEKMNAEGVSEKPAKIILELYKVLENDKLVLVPKKAKVEIFEKIKELEIE